MSDIITYRTPQCDLGSQPRRTLPAVTDATVVVTTLNLISFTQTIQNSKLVRVTTQSDPLLQPQVVKAEVPTYQNFI